MYTFKGKSSSPPICQNAHARGPPWPGARKRARRVLLATDFQSITRTTSRGGALDRAMSWDAWLLVLTMHDDRAYVLGKGFPHNRRVDC